MDASAWISPLEGAKLLGYRQRRQFHSYLGTRGYWDEAANAPSEKSLHLGITRPAPTAGEWEWDQGFVNAYAAYDALPSRRAEVGWTPHQSCEAFREGLRTMFRSPRVANPGMAERREEAYRRLQVFRFEPALAWACRDYGIAFALRAGEQALKLAVTALDPADPFVREGASAAWNALAEFASVPGDHPFIRYGIIPASTETAPLAPLDLPAGTEPITSREPSAQQQMSTLARQLGYPEPAAPQEQTNDDLLTVWEDGRPIALMHRNGMKWRTALTRLLESGRLGASPGSDHAARAERCTFRKVAMGAAHTQPILQAERRTRGTAPTTDHTRERYYNFLGWMRLDADDHPLPALESEARKVVDSLAELYGVRKRDGTLPASEKQVAYALDLARQAGVEVAFDRFSTRKDVGEFLDAMRRAEEERGMVAEAGPKP